ncbi:DoxX family protein [Streptomyces sp. NBC_01233]|uniref:DoxX family protein n=1 Tax=Streptomyces sp. NBC_01233 TaxID=2903787 RepID=UPI002E15AFED|nr:DoxX family membrane protein [Streptomyces sp. NBC_01233]
MEPLVTLVTVTSLLLLAGAFGAVRFRRPTAALRGGLAAMFALTGGAHFVGMREEIVAMVPPALPAPELLVTLTGIAELACALALLWSRTARGSAAVLSTMLVVMFPANVYAAAGGDVPWWDRLGPRTAVQFLFLAATVTVLVRPRDRDPGDLVTSAGPSVRLHPAVSDSATAELHPGSDSGHAQEVAQSSVQRPR